MKKLAIIIILAIVMATLCACDTPQRVRITDVELDENGEPSNTFKVREYTTNAKGEITKDTGWVTITYEEEMAFKNRNTDWHASF